MIVQAMILINMLVTIVTNYFVEVRSDASKQSADSELFEMLFKRVRLGYCSVIEVTVLSVETHTRLPRPRH